MNDSQKMILIFVLLFLYSFYLIFHLKIKQTFVDQLHHSQIRMEKTINQ